MLVDMITKSNLKGHQIQMIRGKTFKGASRTADSGSGVDLLRTIELLAYNPDVHIFANYNRDINCTFFPPVRPETSTAAGQEFTPYEGWQLVL
jgi:hypothetical protein